MQLTVSVSPIIAAGMEIRDQFLMALCGSSDYWGAYLTENPEIRGVDCSIMVGGLGYSIRYRVMLDSDRNAILP